MITLDDDALAFRFPEVHQDSVCEIAFRRTLRIPDDGKAYPLPPGFEFFPLRHLDDFVRSLPDDWLRRGGVVMPMHQAEAMWINFVGRYPCAIKIATGKICAITGEPWVDHLNRNLQDYAVVPGQRWLDGYCVEKGMIRQFVAMPLGEGYSVEEQATGAATFGGLQISVYPMKREKYEEYREHQHENVRFSCIEMNEALGLMDMGLAPGGLMKQDIYDDQFGLDAWDMRHGSRCFVTIANSGQWAQITGEIVPTVPPTAREYTDAGLPWFDYYAEGRKAVAGSSRLRRLKSVLEMKRILGVGPLTGNDPLEVAHPNLIREQGSNRVRECDSVVPR